jgi:RNA polymerase sigma factor (TIGR02999 family)
MTPDPDLPELTRFLSDLGRAGAERDAELLPQLLAELSVIARATLRSQRQGHTLQPTALVNEAYMKLASGEGAHWKDRKHFFATAALAMRQVLVDHERARRREKRGGAGQAVTLHTHMGGEALGPEVDLLDLDEAIAELEALDERRARVVVLRYFGGLEVEEVAEVMQVSRTTVERDWRAARAWLWQRLNPA